MRCAQRRSNGHLASCKMLTHAVSLPRSNESPREGLGRRRRQGGVCACCASSLTCIVHTQHRGRHLRSCVPALHRLQQSLLRVASDWTHTRKIWSSSEWHEVLIATTASVTAFGRSVTPKVRRTVVTSLSWPALFPSTTTSLRIPAG